MEISALTRLLEIIPDSSHFVPPWVPRETSSAIVSQATATSLLAGLSPLTTSLSSTDSSSSTTINKSKSPFIVFTNSSNSNTRSVIKQERNSNHQQPAATSPANRSNNTNNNGMTTRGNKAPSALKMMNNLNTSHQHNQQNHNNNKFDEEMKRVSEKLSNHPEGSNKSSLLFLTSTSKLRRVAEAFAMLRNGVFSNYYWGSTHYGATDDDTSSVWDSIEHVPLTELLKISPPTTNVAASSSMKDFTERLIQEYQQWKSLIAEEKQKLMYSSSSGGKPHNNTIALIERLEFQTRSAIQMEQHCMMNHNTSSCSSIHSISKLLRKFQSSLTSSSAGLHPDLIAQWLLEPNTIHALLSSNFSDLTSMVTLSTKMLNFCQVVASSSSSASVTSSNSSNHSQLHSLSTPLILIPSINLEKPRHWGPFFAKSSSGSSNNPSFDLCVNKEQVEDDLKARITTILVRSLVHAGLLQYPDIQMFVMSSLFTLPLESHPIIATHCQDEQMVGDEDADDGQNDGYRKMMNNKQHQQRNVMTISAAELFESVEIEALIDVLFEVETRMSQQQQKQESSSFLLKPLARTIALVPNSKHQEQTWKKIIGKMLFSSQQYQQHQHQHHDEHSTRRPLSYFSIVVIPFAFDVVTFLIRSSCLKMTQTDPTMATPSSAKKFACIASAPSSVLMSMNGCDLNTTSNDKLLKKNMMRMNATDYQNHLLFRRCLNVNFVGRSNYNDHQSDSDDDEEVEGRNSNSITLPRQIITVDPFF